MSRRPRLVGALDPASPGDRLHLLGAACVRAAGERCVQCGICTYNCPLGIDVRTHAWRSRPILDRRCLSCGECIRRCPRQALRFAALTERP